MTFFTVCLFLRLSVLTNSQFSILKVAVFYPRRKSQGRQNLGFRTLPLLLNPIDPPHDVYSKSMQVKNARNSPIGRGREAEFQPIVGIP